MKSFLKDAVKSTLKRFDLAVIRQSKFEKLMANNAQDVASDIVINFLLQLPHKHLPNLLNNMRKSRAQIRQDLFVLAQSDFKRNGFFVEFGATNGFIRSNTHLLEKEFDWTGILAEPAKCWHDDLRKNRNCHIETSCVWTESNATLQFNEAGTAELSTIDTYTERDFHAPLRKGGKLYEVKTISINDLLQKYHAPSQMDYLSIDTEGSEFDILNSLDFGRYRFNIITCEHNFTPDREKVHRLLTSKGYKRTMENVSKFDDWYILA